MKTYLECYFVENISEEEFPIVYFRVIWAVALPFLFFVFLMLIYFGLIIFNKAKWNIGYLLTLIIFIVIDF